MTETKNFLDLYITEDTLDEILAAMRDPLPIAPDGRPQIVERLRELYLAVHVEHRLAPMNTRTDLDKALKPLLRQSLDLQRRIGDDEIQWMNKILSVAALDLYVQSKKSGAPSETYVPPPDILQKTESALRDFSKLLTHLCTMMDQFDELDPEEYAEWIKSAGNKKEIYIRNEITPHFRKRGGVGPDTIAVRHIAEIYEFAFGRQFSINPRENYERGRDDIKIDPSKVARYSGRAVQFACAVIKVLKIGGILVPHTEKNLPTIPPDVDPSEIDILALNKELAFAREDVQEGRLINRIGDLWINDSRRREKEVGK
jgi:hypothetical protein